LLIHEFFNPGFLNHESADYVEGVNAFFEKRKQPLEWAYLGSTSDFRRGARPLDRAGEMPDSPSNCGNIIPCCWID